MIVTKFGGSSLADAAQFKKVKHILDMDGERKYVVPSAPGKRGPGDDKITDLLYASHAAAAEGKSPRHLLERIRARYEEIVEELGIDMDFAGEFAVIAAGKGFAPQFYHAGQGFASVFAVGHHALLAFHGGNFIAFAGVVTGCILHKDIAKNVAAPRRFGTVAEVRRHQ